MKNLILFLLLVSFANVLSAQDILITRNGDEFQVKVLEITPDLVKYKKTDNPDGPLISVLKSTVYMVKYANGTKDFFVSQEKNVNKISANKQSEENSDLAKIASLLKKEKYPMELVLLMNENITYGRSKIITNPKTIRSVKKEFTRGFINYRKKIAMKYAGNKANYSAGKRLVAIVEPQHTVPGHVFKFFYRVTYGLVSIENANVTGVNDPDFDFLFGYSLNAADNDYYHAAARMVARVCNIYRDLVTDRYKKANFYKAQENNFISKLPTPIGTEVIK